MAPSTIGIEYWRLARPAVCEILPRLPMTRSCRIVAVGELMRKHKGFSLIELLLVVAVILIVSAIAVPNFLRSRLRANEASAVASLRVINTAAVTYSIPYPDVGFPAQLSALGGANPCSSSSTQACLIDDILAQ